MNHKTNWTQFFSFFSKRKKITQDLLATVRKSRGKNVNNSDTPSIYSHSDADVFSKKNKVITWLYEF